MTARGAPRARGFSIVELMVSVVIGLLALLFATRVITGAEQSKQASLGGSDAMQNGMLALFSINGDAAQAGWGLNDPMIAGCDTVFSDTAGFSLAAANSVTGGVSTVTHPLGAAVISFNGTAPDQISFYSGTSMTGTGTALTTTAYTDPGSGNNVQLDRDPRYAFAVGEAIVVVPAKAGTKCGLAQITAMTTAGAVYNMVFASGAGSAYRFNSGHLGASFVQNQGRVFDLGPAANLNLHTWSVSNGFLQLQASNLTGASAAPTTVIDNVVSIKAEYGFDTRSAANFLPESGLAIAQWSAGMIDADNDGTVGGATDYQRIAAVRIAVVARSKAPEKPDTSGVCSATTVAPQVFTTSEPSGIAAVPLTPSVTVTGDTVDWKCYRYRVFEAIVPMRNAGWRPTP